MRIGIDCHVLEKRKSGVGVARYLMKLLNYWSRKNGIEFFLYFKDRIISDNFLSSSDFLSSPVFTKKIAKNPFNIKSLALYYNFSLPIAVAKDKIDVLFLPFYMRPFFCKIPTVNVIHDISYISHSDWFKLRYRLPLKLLTWRAVKKSFALLASSQYTKDEIIKFCDVKENKIFPVLLAADEKFNSQKSIDKIGEAKRKYNLNKKYLFYTGSIFSRRHVSESIKAFEKLLDNKLDYQFLISGDDLTCPVQGINQMIERVNKKYNNAIIKVDYVHEDDLLYIYQGAELFVWPSEYEGFGLPPLEAMACGTPVLTTKKTSLAEVLGDYPIAVDNPSNVEEIKEKMIKVLSNEQLRNEMIQKGLERVQKFSWQKTAQETLKILTKI
jgi:glycosyltransferase involved in cell wall biosynthesis